MKLPKIYKGQDRVGNHSAKSVSSKCNSVKKLEMALTESSVSLGFLKAVETPTHVPPSAGACTTKSARL